MIIYSKTLGAAACAAALAFITPNLLAQNLLVDPSFENQTPAASGGWSLFNGAAFSTAEARTGTFSMKDSGGGNFSVPGSFETFAASPGQEYDLTGYGLAPTAPGAGTSIGLVQITFFSGANGTGNNLGTIDVSTGGNATGANNAQGSAPINASSPLGSWIFLDTGIAEAPATTQSVEAFTIVVDQNPTTVYFDDLSFTQVQAPEPSTIALMSMALVGFAAMRRRK
jgi:hypothetical protein